MSEYTKEQEAAAVEFMAREFSDWKAAVIVTAMAKRTAEAERLRDVADEDAARAAMREHAAAAERDALKARVVELERALSEADNDRDALRDMVREQSAQLATVTREVWEALSEDAETRALYGRTRNGGDDPEKPANAAARLVVAIRKMLEAKP